MPIKFSQKVPPLTIIRSREKFILDLIKNKSVLHGGCVDSGILEERIQKGQLFHSYIEKHAKSVIGVDNDKAGIDKMREFGFQNVFYADLENWESENKFDIIILGEIIEHVNNCGSFLETIKKFCSEETIVIFTTPNAYYFLYWIYSLFGKESIHPDHNYLFSFISIKTLLQKYGFRVDQNLILWDDPGFLRTDDKLLKKIAKTIATGIFKILALIRFIWPHYGKSLIVLAKLKN